MSRLTQLITALFRRRSPSEPPESPVAQEVEQGPVQWNLVDQRTFDWTLSCPDCKFTNRITSGPIETQFNCQSCGNVFEPFPDALTLNVSKEVSWATEETLQNLYEVSTNNAERPTADWRPSAYIEQACPNCKELLKGKVQIYRLHRCPSCQVVFLPVLKTVGVRSNNTLERFGRFPVLDTLGHGGMGIVYKAHHPERDCPFALKVILNRGDWSDISRFYREGETVARLKHPHIVKLHEVGQYDGIPYLALEYLAGGSLRDRLKQGKLSVQQTLSLCATLARTLDYAHERGVIHRDLKPANVLLTEDGTPKISDFGLVKRMEGSTELAGATIAIPSWYFFLRKIAMNSADRTGSMIKIHPDELFDEGLVLGTPAFMSPEQREGDSEKVGPATDIFAFGVMLHQMLTGRLPVRRKFNTGEAKQERYIPPSTWNPEVPRKLNEIVSKCLQKAPEDRFASAGDLANALESVETG